MDAEVGIIGVGTMGSMTMWQLAKKGVSVIGFEQFGIGHDRSAAAGETRLFRTPHNPEYLTIFKDAYSAWSELEQETQQNLLALKNALMIGGEESPFMKNVLHNMKLYKTEYKILRSEEAKRKYPQHKLLPDEIMVLDKNAGFIRPEYSVLSAVKLAEELGATIYRNTCVESIQSENGKIKVHANGEVYKFGKVLITAGPWAGRLLGGIKNHIVARRLLSTWFSPKNIREYSPDQFPVFIRTTNDFSIHGTPSLNGNMLKVSLRNNKKRVVNNPDELDRAVKVEEISKISEVVQNYLPGLYPDPVRSTIYMDSFTEDNKPLVGKLPNNENIVLLCGFSGHGFKIAPVMGKIASEILLEGRTQYPINFFSPMRYVNKVVD